jgi:hypothetical protein
MHPLDLFSLITGVFSLYALVLSVCKWVSPIHRLHALDDAVHHVEDLLASMQEDTLFDYHKLEIIRDAHKRMFWCVSLCIYQILVHVVPQVTLPHSESARARLQRELHLGHHLRDPVWSTVRDQSCAPWNPDTSRRAEGGHEFNVGRDCYS